MRVSLTLLRCLPIALLALAQGCGSDPAPPAAPTAGGPKAFLIETLQRWYLWADQLPQTIDADAYADADAALAALRVPQDRFSSIADAQAQNLFYGVGQTVAFGILYRIADDHLLLLMVQPDSPAAAAGLRRGQRIVAIDGQSIAALTAAQAVDEAFGPAQPGVQREFLIEDAGGARPVTVTKAQFAIRYVLASTLFERAGRRIGYVHFYSFADPGLLPWRAALDDLLAAGARDLIVDLRTNGGGVLSTAAQVGSALGDMAGRTMAVLRFNDRNTDANRAYLFDDDPRGGRFERLVWLTTAQTCSASEALIKGVAPWRASTRIGTTTCGKPVGFTPFTFEDRIYNIVDFEIENALGEGGYFDGLAPDCEVVDDGSGQFGEAAEPLTAAALTWLDTGQCPPAATAAKQASPDRQRPSRVPLPQHVLR